MTSTHEPPLAGRRAVGRSLYHGGKWRTMAGDSNEQVGCVDKGRRMFHDVSQVCGAEIVVSGLCSKCGKLCDRLGQRYCRDCHALNMRIWRYGRRPSDEERLKQRCRGQSRYYFKQGLIEWMPCQVCLSRDSEMHHQDYNQPLLVDWLCRKCHLDLHGAERPQKVRSDARARERRE